jgi:hypothetical protein
VGTGPPPDVPTPNPIPTPPVPPAPAPDPVFPDGQFGLSKFVYDSFRADTTLPAASKPLLAAALADGLEGVAAKATSTQTDVATLLSDTKNANTTAFAKLNGVDVSKAGALKSVISAKIYDLYKSQKLNTAADVATAWREMAVGLRSVK